MLGDWMWEPGAPGVGLRGRRKAGVEGVSARAQTGPTAKGRRGQGVCEITDSQYSAQLSDSGNGGHVVGGCEGSRRKLGGASARDHA